LLSSDIIKAIELKKLRYIRIWVEIFLVYALWMNLKGYIRGKKVEITAQKIFSFAIVGSTIILEMISRLKNINATKISLILLQCWTLNTLFTHIGMFEEEEEEE
jgi:DNA integrity scanning protein DisA with diadenylate cyclase activity